MVSRYHDGSLGSPESADTWIEFLPQNCWKGINADSLTNDEWNGESNKAELTGRVLGIEESEDLKWYGLKSVDEFRKLLDVGDTSKPVNLRPTFGQNISNLSVPLKRRRKKWINAEDGEIMGEAVMTRDPEVFYAKRKVEGKKHRTNLVILAGGNCNIKAKTIQIRAKIYGKIIDELQRQGHNVGVHCIDPIGSHHHDSAHFVCWQVKRHDEQMSVPQLQRDLGHPAVYRTAIFDVIGAAPVNPRGGLGYTANDIFDTPDASDSKTQALLEAIRLEIGEPTVILNLLKLDANLNLDELDPLLNKIQAQLTNLITRPKLTGIHIISNNEDK